MTSPLDISLPETSAGFQNNSEKVAKIIADFIEVYLFNNNPLSRMIFTYVNYTNLSPNDSLILKPMLTSSV